MIKNNSKGVTMAELMISITILTTIIASFVGLFVVQQKHSTKQQNYIQLVQRGRSTMQYLQGRIREIGYAPTGDSLMRLVTAQPTTLRYLSDHNANGFGVDDSVIITLQRRTLMLTDFQNPAPGTPIADEIDILQFAFEDAAGNIIAGPVNDIKVIRVAITFRKLNSVSRDYPVTVRGLASIRN